MGRNTRISLGDHSSTSELRRAGLRLLEQEEAKLDSLRKNLAIGEQELNQGKGLDGEAVMKTLIGK